MVKKTLFFNYLTWLGGPYIRGCILREDSKMAVTIPDDIFQATRMTEDELRQEIAVLLFQREKLTLGQGSRLAGMSQLQFQHLLASRKIPRHYDLPEFEEDIKTLKELCES